MIKKIAVTFSVILYAIIVPFLEINETHIWNPDWTPHVRIHEVWQLITNSSIGALCLWLVWFKKETRLRNSIKCFTVSHSYGRVFIGILT